MAAKKGAKRGKKTVTVSIDVETLERLTDAIAGLAKLAAAYVHAADDPAVKRNLIKRAKAKAKRGR